MLAVLAGTSVFAHLCLYDVNPSDKDVGRADKGGLTHVHELHPTNSTGAIMAYLWLNERVCARCGHLSLTLTPTLTPNLNLT